MHFLSKANNNKVKDPDGGEEGRAVEGESVVAASGDSGDAAESGVDMGSPPPEPATVLPEVCIGIVTVL